MSKYDNILYPTDGSDGAKAALETVRDLAETYDATVHVLNVIDVSHAAQGIGDDPNKETSPGMVGDPQGADTPMGGERELPEKVREEANEHGEEVVEEAAQQLGDVDLRADVRSGDPADVILDYADANDIDLLVMGTQGRTGLERYLIGSVAEEVVRLADVPVLTVRDADEY